MKKLIDLEITREELLENQHADCEVDSTTSCTPGSSKQGKEKGNKTRARKLVVKGSSKKDATISAAKERALQLFKTHSSTSASTETSKESNQVAELQKELQHLKELLRQTSKGINK